MTIINEEKKYRELKESKYWVDNETDTEKINLIEKGKKKGTDEVINKSLKSQI